MTAGLVVEMPGEPPFEVRLDPAVVTVGRAEDNVLSLRDMNVSRHHFSIERKGEFSIIQDRGSRNGTLVNGVAVLNKVLVEGDRVQVGGSTLLFRAQASRNALPPDEIPRPTAQVRLPGKFGMNPYPGRQLPGGSSAVTARRSPSPAVDPARTPSELGRTHDPESAPADASDTGSREPGTRHGTDSPSRRVAIQAAESRWRTLAEVACAVNSEHDLDPLLERMLDAVLSLVPAKAGFLVLREGEELRVRANRNSSDVKVGSTLGEIVAGSKDTIRLSQQICLEAIAKKRPVLTQDAVSDQRLNQFLSVVSLQLKSILCVPFSSNDEVLGVVYLDEPTCDPFEEEGEAVELVGAFGDLAGIALANARMMAEIAEREQMEKELAIAAQIQRSLLPQAPPPVEGLKIAGKTVSARQVGGDIYDFFARQAHRDVLISIGDVAGKGVGAGLVMATVRALLHAYAELYPKTDDLLVELNSVLSKDLDPGIFVSYLLIRYDQETGLLHYTGAGHEHLILYRPATGQMEFLRAGGVVLGLVGAIRDKISEKQMKLRPDDVVVLYTDGATEAQGESSEEFGLERIGEAIKAGPLEPDLIVERIIDAVTAFTGADRQLHDDLTVVAIQKT